MPSLAALFSTSLIEVGGNECPFLGSFRLDEFFEEKVFFCSPRPFGFFFVFSNGFFFDIRLKKDGFLKGGLLISMVGLKVLVLFFWSVLGDGDRLGMLNLNDPGRMPRVGRMIHG